MRITKEITTILRKILISQSELNPNFVRDAESEYGTDLDKDYENSIFNSIEPYNTLILFELRDRNNDSDMTEITNCDKLVLYKSYQLHCIIYGDDSGDVANKLVSRLNSSYIKQVFQENSLYLESVSMPIEIHEFKNMRLWQRHDININLSCELIFNQINNLECPINNVKIIETHYKGG